MSQLKTPRKSKPKPAPKKKTAPKKEGLPVAEMEGMGETALLSAEEVLRMQILVKAGTLALVTEVNLKSLEGFTREGHLKNTTSNDGSGRVYDLLSSMRALIRLYQTRAKRKADAGGELEREKLLKLAAQREVEEIKLRKARGEVFEGYIIEKVLGAIVARMRSRLLSLPSEVAPIVMDRSNINEIAELIRKPLYEAMEELAHFDMNAFKEYGDKEWAEELERQAALEMHGT